MTVLAIVQAWNRDDPILGFVVPWMEALASRVDRLLVMALEQRQTSDAPNISIYSLGKERRAGRLRYLASWHRAWAEILATSPPDLVFAHMSPIYAVLAAPYTRRRGIPIVTWFAHRHVSSTLRLAHRLSSRVLTINRESYPHRPDDVLVVGHGIDSALFKPGDGILRRPPELLSVGRLSPIKDPATFLRGVHAVRGQGADLRARWLGDPPKRDESYAQQILRLRRQLDLDDAVEFAGSLSNRELPPQYCRSIAHVNLCPTGALDKAPLESMACAVPTLVANEGFRPLLGRWHDVLLFRYDDPRHLAHQVSQVLSLSPEARGTMGGDLRRAVIEQHSLDRLWDRLVAIFGNEIDRARRASPRSSSSPLA